MIDHDELRQLTDALRDKGLAIASHAPRLRDRAAVPSARTGFGARASGAQPSSSSGHTTWATDDSWECLCGARGKPGLDETQTIAEMFEHHDETHPTIDYADPTGMLATQPEPRDPLDHDWRQFLRLLREMDERGTVAVEILVRNGVVPRTAPQAICPDDWCTSCWRYDKRHEPVAVRADGTTRYSRFCRRCGDWAQTHAGHPPPLSMVLAMHDHGKLSPRMVADAEKEHAANVAAARKAKKKRK